MAFPFAHPFGGDPAITAPQVPRVQELFGVRGSTDYGTDSSTFPKLDSTFSNMSGARAVAENVARRWLTPKGFLSFHPDGGLDMRAYLNETITDEVLNRLKQEAQYEAEQDERVLAADVTVTYDQNTNLISLGGKLTLATSTFSMTLKVSELTSDLLLEAA